MDTKPKKKLPRQEMPVQSVERRRRNFEEVALGYSDELAIAEASRCLICKVPHCVAGCPVNIDIPGFVKLLQEGKFVEAAVRLKKQTALPAVCGRVCPQESQCEAKCALGIKGESVAIGRLERFAADYAREHGGEPPPEIAPSTGKKVAVVGCGPAGITVAGDMRRWGHDVTIFEALHLPGGVLMYGIPEFRLPKKYVEYEVRSLLNLGVSLKLDYVIGMSETVDQLLDEFDSVFIGTGAGLPQFLGIPGENAVGVFSANEFLTRFTLMKAYDFPNHATVPIRAKRIVTVGGGNVAMDAARVALRIGAESTIVYRRSRAEMPARAEEIHHAEEEGVAMNLLTAPVRVVTDAANRVTGIECQKMELGEPDASGRRRPVPLTGSGFVIPADAIVISIGNTPNPLVSMTSPDLKTSKWGTLVADETTMATSKPRVYAGGDIVSGAATVISAMGQAKKAALAMHRDMMGVDPPGYVAPPVIKPKPKG